MAARQAEHAAEASDRPLARSAEALAAIHDGQLASLRVADAARREWAEAHAPLEASAKAADRELRARHLEERIPVTDAEVATASAEPRETPAIDPETWAALRREQAAQVDAERQARAEASARLTPVTDAEIARYGAGARARGGSRGRQRPSRPGPQPRPSPGSGTRSAASAPRWTSWPAKSRRPSGRAEMVQAAIDEPVVHEPQPEPSLEASWQPGNAQGQYEAEAEQGADAEMEIG